MEISENGPRLGRRGTVENQSLVSPRQRYLSDKERVRIMILTPSFNKTSPIQGALLFAKYLHDKGHAPIFASLDGQYSPNLVGEIRQIGLYTHDFGMAGWLGLRHLEQVRRYISYNNVDVIVSYCLRPTIVNSLLAGVNRIATVREMPRELYELSYGWPVGPLAARLHFRSLRKLDGIFVLTAATKDHLTKNGVNPAIIHVVNNFVDVKNIRRALDDGSSNIDLNCLDIGYFGSLVVGKRVDIAVAAVEKLVHKYGHKNLRFHLVGTGPLQTRLLRQAAELRVSRNVVCHGFLQDPVPLMKKMRIVVLSSESEGLPRCLLEAMSLGKTCVTSDIAGVRELISHGKTGYLFRVGDVDGLASLINDIIRFDRYLDPDSLYRFVSDHYDISVCGERMVSQLENITGRRL